MPVFLVTAKKDIISSFKITKGMNVEIVSDSNPLNTNGGRLVKEAFKKKYGFEPTGAFWSSSYFDVKKL